MQIDLIVHVNTLPGGHVVATPVHLPAYAGSGDDEEALLADIARRVSDVSFPMMTRRPLLVPTRASLDVVVARIRVDKQTGEHLPLRLSAVLLSSSTDPHAAVVAVAPSVGVRVAGRSREDALDRLAVRCGKVLSKWAADDALAAELTGEVTLRTVKANLKEEAQASPKKDPNQKFLAGIGDELTARASATGLDERGELIERVLASLALPERSSVMLVGPPEVGKTALIRELALRLREGRVPAPLQARELWSVPVNDLIAGAQYTGQWQDRAQRLVRAARERRTIIAVGDPVAIVDAGRWSGSDNNVGRMLRPHMESGAITLICEATPEQVAAARKVEPSFVEAFHRVDVVDPGPEVTHRIVTNAARLLEGVHGVGIDPDALTAAVDLTRRYEPYRGFPGKAVRLIEETVGAGEARRLTKEEVIRSFATRTGLPLALLSDQEPLPPEQVEEHFQARVLGQPEAVQAMVDLVMVLKAGLNAPGKPLGVYLFVGPTGVGKTELAKALAELLFGSRERVVRFDMGEHSTGDALPRLLGSAWQREDEGELTRRVREQPFCVVLLDEIEKAHHLVFDALLAAIGEGRLTDAHGRTADFRNAIVIMTSNLGAKSQDAPRLGFASDGSAGRDRRLRYYDEQVERFFRPEFVNRLDRVIVFNPLEEEVVRRIVRRELGRLLMREGIVRRQLLVEVEEDAVAQLASRAFHPRYGARPLQRGIERLVIQPLARRIVEGRCGSGDVVRVRSSGPDLVVDLQRVAIPEPKAAPEPAEGLPRPAGGLAKALIQADALRRRLELDVTTPLVRAPRDELSALVKRTQDPAFWDDPEQARRTLSRVYELQSALDALAAVRNRAEGLLEMGRQMRVTGDRTRLGELRAAIEEVEGRRAMIRLDLAGLAGHGSRPDAQLSVTPVSGGGDPSSWVERLLTMYAGWAARRGRTATSGPDGGSLTIEGASSFDLLAGEGGLHRWVPRENEAQPCLARVAIRGLDDEASVVVRVYDEGRDQVRDPRTGAQARKVSRVLSGAIDDFLIASIAARSRSARPESARAPTDPKPRK